MFVFFFKQETAYEMRISDWSSDLAAPDDDADADIRPLRIFAPRHGSLAPRLAAFPWHGRRRPRNGQSRLCRCGRAGLQSDDTTAPFRGASAWNTAISAGEASRSRRSPQLGIASCRERLFW